MKKIPVIKNGVRERIESFGALIFTNRTPILAINEDALEIWKMCDGKNNVADIIEALSDGRVESQVTAERVNEFLNSFVELDIIELLAVESC